MSVVSFARGVAVFIAVIVCLYYALLSCDFCGEV